MVTTPRRAVGSGYTASVERPGPSGGMSSRSGRPPTCSSIVRDATGVRRGLVTRTTATPRSPTVTRSGARVRSTSRVRRPTTNGRATTSTIRHPAATTINSTHPSSQPATYATTPRASTVHPLAVSGSRRSTFTSAHRPDLPCLCHRIGRNPTYVVTQTLAVSGSGSLARPHRGREVNAVDDLLDELAWFNLAELGLGGEEHAVPHHGGGDDAHVVGGDERAGLGGRQRPGRPDQTDRPACRHAEAQLGQVAGGRAEAHDVAAD